MPTAKQLIGFLSKASPRTRVYLTEADVDVEEGFVVLESALAELNQIKPAERRVTDYTRDLKAQMVQHGISQNELARALQKDPGQVSRWFTENSGRRVTPNVKTAEQIEPVMRALVQDRHRREAQERQRLLEKATCSECQYVNDLEAAVCFQCGAPRPPGVRRS